MHLPYVATLPCETLTSAKQAIPFNYINSPRNLPVIFFKNQLRFDSIMVMSLWPTFSGPPCFYTCSRTCVIMLARLRARSRDGTGSHFVTQRPSDPEIQRPGDPVDPVTLFYNEHQMKKYSQAKEFLIIIGKNKSSLHALTSSDFSPTTDT